MMLFHIDEIEEIAIRDYFNHPERYMSKSHRRLLLNGSLPPGTKVSRPKDNDKVRHYMIPIGSDGQTYDVPITSMHSGDPGLHSATQFHGKIYIHQNKDDLPLKIPDDIADDLANDADENEFEKEYRQMQYHLLGKPNYVHQDILSKTIKFAIDIDDPSGDGFYLKRQSFYSDQKQALPPSSLVNASLFRRCDRHHVKKISITPNYGKNLDEFMSDHGKQCSPRQIEMLAQAILKQYLLQLHEHGIVHTDIKAANICIHETSDVEQPFDVKFIDLDESFYVDKPQIIGQGTPGYMAPEFFKTLGDFEKQLDNRAIDSQTYEATLNVNYMELFSQKSDLFALSRVLLNDLLLQNDSSIYHFAIAMSSLTPHERPSAEDMYEILDISRANYIEGKQSVSFLRCVNIG